MTIGEKLKMYRMQRRMTQGELAKAVGSTVAAISRYELDQREPRYSLLLAIANVLDVPEEEFLEAYPKTPMKIDEYKSRLQDIENKLRSAQQEQTPASQIKEIQRALNMFSQLLYEERFTIKIAEKRTSEETMLLRTSKGSRKGKMLTAFNQLNRDGQDKAIERTKELGLIPGYLRMSLPDVLKLFVYNQYKLAYSVISDVEKQETYTVMTPDGEQDRLVNVRHMILQRRPEQKFRLRWDFLYYSCTDAIEDDIIAELLKKLHVPEEDCDRISFVFDDEKKFNDMFSRDHEDKCELPSICQWWIHALKWPILFILIGKENYEIENIIEYDTNTMEIHELKI